jgi:site-specific DNA recombinase
MCVKKKTKTNNCRRPAVRAERIEDGIGRFYGRFRVQPEHVEQIQAAVREELATSQAEAARGLQRATKLKGQTQDERKKLLQAHYAGAIPQDLLASEMQRLTRELAEAEAEIAAAQATNEDVEATLARALTAAQHCERAYLTAPNQIRRQINQGFFVKLFIGEDGEVAQVELTEPFAALLDGEPFVLAARPTTNTDTGSDVVGDAPNTSTVDSDTAEHRATDVENGATLRKYNPTPRGSMPVGRGVKGEYLVGAVGFEPTTPGL